MKERSTPAAPTETASRPARGRPRSDASREAILSATTELLKEGSLRELTIDAIARRANVGKFTIYRWWPTKAHVALEAVLGSMRKQVTLPDTGSTEKDLSLHVRKVIRFYQSLVGRTFRELLAEATYDPEFGEIFRQRFLERRRDVVQEMWERGVARGDVDPAVPLQVAIDLISAPMVYRLMAGHQPLNDAEADAMIAGAFRGLASKPHKSNGKDK